MRSNAKVRGIQPAARCPFTPALYRKGRGGFERSVEEHMAKYDFDMFTIGAGSGGVAASRRVHHMSQDGWLLQLEALSAG